MKRRIFLVRGARQLLTLRGWTGPRRGKQLRDLAVIEDGSILVEDGVIRRVGPTRQIENLAEAKMAEEISATGRVVMPAFVDCYATVVAMPPRVAWRREKAVRGHPDGEASARERVLHWVRTTSSSTLSFIARRHLEMALRHGTTTLEVKSGGALDASCETKLLRTLSGIGSGIVSLVPTYCGACENPSETTTRAEYIRGVANPLLPKIRQRKFVRFVEGVCDPASFSADELRPYFAEAVRWGFPIKVTGDLTGRAGCVPLALEFSAATVAGLNWSSHDDIYALANSATAAVLMPVQPPTNESRQPPGRALIDAGAAVALASGFHPSTTSTISMQAVVATACDGSGFTIEEAITAATVNGAHAAGLGMACGTLEAGRQADLLILNVSDYRELALHIGVNLVSVVMRNGEVVLREAPLA